jgi:hypothetical protein
MDAAPLASLLTELFTAIQLVSGYGLPTTLPEVHFVPQQTIQEKFCAGPCRIRAAYEPESGVYIDERLDVVRNSFERSILVHELVHHLQATSGLFDPALSECERATKDEREAYDIQNRYLGSVKDMRRFPLPRLTASCGGG